MENSHSWCYCGEWRVKSGELVLQIFNFQRSTKSVLIQNEPPRRTFNSPLSTLHKISAHPRRHASLNSELSTFLFAGLYLFGGACIISWNAGSTATTAALFCLLQFSKASVQVLVLQSDPSGNAQQALPCPKFWCQTATEVSVKF